MRPRPRKAENEIAKLMTELCKHHLIDFVFERVPVIGRSGPDLTYPNPFDFAIDVKSRKECPKTLFDAVNRSPLATHKFDGFVAIRMDALHLISIQDRAMVHGKTYKLVTGYLDHMTRWTDKNGGTPAVVIHRPRKQYKHSVMVLRTSDSLSQLKPADVQVV